MGMRNAGLSGALVATLLLVPQAGLAQDSAANNSNLGSVYVRCDGFPPHRSAGELAARILLIMATAGLAGPGERADVGKRLTGADGVAACSEAISGESDPIRKVQLTLARAVHHIEAKEFDAALADAKSVPDLAGPGANELGFRHSLYLSALELQASALVRLDRPAEAEATALQMAAIAPYDLITQQHTQRFIGLTGEMAATKREFLDRFARIAPGGYKYFAGSDEWVGDYRAAAAQYRAFGELLHGFANDKTPPAQSHALEAARAVALAMAGDMTESNLAAASARKTLDSLDQSGLSLNQTNSVTEAETLLDFQNIVAELGAGKASQARMGFEARSRWTIPIAPVVADLMTRLRKGAKPEEIAGSLARDPAELRQAALKEWAGAISASPENDKHLYAAIRPLTTRDQYTHWTGDINDTSSDRFLPAKTGKETYTGDFVFMRGADGIPTGDALMLYCALVARARNVSGFVLHPYRPRLDAAIVRFGNSGDPGMPAELFVDSASVVTALTPEFYDPTRRPDDK